MSSDPTAPLAERTPEQVAAYVDDHLVMALDAAAYLFPGDRQQQEDYTRDRLVWASDSWETDDTLRREERRRRLDRLGRAIGLRS